MATVKNKLRQPLVINTNAKESIHFLAKETKKVPDELLSEGEFKNHIDNGNLLVIRLG